MKKAYGKFFFTGIILAALLTGCGRGNGTDQGESRPAQETTEQPAEEDEAAPGIAFACKDMDGNAVSEAVFSGSKLTMVNVWATYCNPCLSEMPALGELAASYDTEEFQIIGIVSDVMEGEDQSTAEGLVEQTGANYIHLLLNESIYNGLLTDVTAVPTTFFIDGEGKVLDVVVGAMKKSAWEDRINGLLEEL